MVGTNDSIEVGPGHGHHSFIGEPQALEDRHLRPLVDSQLDVGQHQGTVALRHQEGARLAGGLDREAVAVDQPDPGADGVDAQAGPGQVEKGQRRDEVDLDAAVGAQQLDRTLGDQRGTGHGIEHFAVSDGRRHQLLHHGGVDLVQGLASLVQIVERRGRLDQAGAGVAGGAHEADGTGGDGLGGGDADEPRVARPEADDHDPPGHVPEAGAGGGTT